MADRFYLSQDHWLGLVLSSTILDDYSRYIIAGSYARRCVLKMSLDTLELALAASGCASVHVLHKPRLLSDNGPSYVAGELADFLADNGMSHVRGAPFHPQTQGRSNAGTRP
ncbi:MAG: transposase family protein [Sphingomonadales bacterium]|nr:transposase family protein [Sphingomonadales bacterium]